LGQYPGMVNEKFIKLGSNCYNLNMRADQGFKVLPLLALSLSIWVDTLELIVVSFVKFTSLFDW
jgi:hypothetical protein